MKVRKRHLHAIPVGLALAVGLALYFRFPRSVRPAEAPPKTSESTQRPEKARAPTPAAERVRIPPDPDPPKRSATPRRTEAVQLVDTEWIYGFVTNQEWSPESLARLRDLFLNPPTTEAWEMALWAVRICPLSEATGWIDEFLRLSPSVRDRSDATLALAEREDLQALPVLQSQLASLEPLLSAAAAEAIARRSLWDPAARPLADSLSRNPRYSRFLPEWGERE